MGQPRDLSVEPHASGALLLSELELALLVLSDVGHADLGAEGREDLVFGGVDDRLEAFDFLYDRVQRFLGLQPKPAQHE